jgi:hypothetical protein
MKAYHLYIVAVLVIAAIFADNFVPKKYSYGRFEKFGTGNYAFDSQRGLVCNINLPPTSLPIGAEAGLADGTGADSSGPVISFAPAKADGSAASGGTGEVQELQNSERASLSKRFGFVDDNDRPYCSELK